MTPRFVLLMLLVIVGVRAALEEDEVLAVMRFPRTKHLKDDDWKDFSNLKPRLKRWDKENNTLEHDPINMEEHTIVAKSARGRDDMTGSNPPPHSEYAAPKQPVSHLTDSSHAKVLKNGFEIVELHPRLMPLLRKIKQTGLEGVRSGPTTAGSWLVFFGGGNDVAVEDKLARQLQGSDSFTLSNGDNYHYAFRCAGFVIRKGGPEGSKLEGTGFDNVAQRVHIDQDLDGEPLLSMGLTWVFKLPYMRLLNVWSPLYDVRMRPMAFADTRTLQRERDVVRYRTNSTANAGGKFGSFKSDRLMSLFAEDHKWYWYPRMRFGEAIAFDTAEVPHSSFSLNGEKLLGATRNRIEQLRDATSLEEKARLCSQTLDFDLKSLSFDAEATLAPALAFVQRICDNRVSYPQTEYATMLEWLSRASLEIRCVTFVAPKEVVHNALTTAAVGLAGIVFAISRRTWWSSKV